MGHEPADHFLVRRDRPGIVSVHLLHTGRLMVRSAPGRPTEPDEGAGT